MINRSSTERLSLILAFEGIVSVIIGTSLIPVALGAWFQSPCVFLSVISVNSHINRLRELKLGSIVRDHSVS